MRVLQSLRFPGFLALILTPLFLAVPQANAQSKCKTSARPWNATAGAETPDQAKQGDAFFPNEVWICEGDSIEWRFANQNEPHTVTFLSQSGEPTTPGSILDVSERPPMPVVVPPNFTDTLVFTAPAFTEAARPPAGPPVGPPTGGCPSATPSPSTVSGVVTSCVSSPPSNGGGLNSPTYTVTFPTPGNYKLLCLIHTNMNGTVHVLPKGSALPFDQFDYDQQARVQAHDLLFNGTLDEDSPQSPTQVLMGGQLSATAGGRSYLAVVRFVPGTLRIHTGDTVEFVNVDPEEPHTVTFGTELCSGNCPTVPLNVTTAADGAMLGTIKSSTDSLASGFLQASPEDAVGNKQNPPGITRIRITFPNEGTFNYFCALHDTDGMKGTVVVTKDKNW